MLVKVINKEITKCREDVTIPTEIVIAWAKWVEAQRVQTAVISSICKSGNFDAITHKENRLGGKKHASNTVIAKKKFKYWGQGYKPGWCPAYGKGCDNCCKINHFKAVCRGSQTSVVNTVQKEDIHEQEPGIKMVNINSINFNSNHSVITAKLKTSPKQATMMVPYKVDHRLWW